jgi:hypothetical protein
LIHAAKMSREIVSARFRIQLRRGRDDPIVLRLPLEFFSFFDEVRQGSIQTARDGVSNVNGRYPIAFFDHAWVGLSEPRKFRKLRQ